MTRIDLARAADVGGQTVHATCQGRLTLESGQPISSTDQTAKTTVYFTPYLGNLVGTYSGSAWTVSSFAEKSLSLSGLTANKNYDIFIVDGTLALEALVWTNDTTRATALVLQDGVLVKSGAVTRRYLGTIRITGTTGQCEDSAAKRFVWNMYNRVERTLLYQTATGSWTYATSTWRQANADAAMQFAFVVGLAGQGLRATYSTRVHATNNQFGFVGIGLNSTSTNTGTNGTIIAAAVSSGEDVTLVSTLTTTLALGYSYCAAVEYAGGATLTYFGAGYFDLGATLAC